MEYIYKSEFLHDLAGHKEFTRSFNDANRLRTFLLLFYSIFGLWVIPYFTISSVVRYFLIFALVFLITYLVTNPKKGDIQYKRMLQVNNGEPVHQTQYFTETGVHCINSINGNRANFAYDQFRYVIESKNLLILVMQHRSCLILDKRSIQGADTQTLFDFLKENCPKLKGKKPRKTILGKCIRLLFITVLTIGSIWALLNLPGFSLMDRIYGRLDNSMTYHEMAEELAKLDIVISDQTIEEMEAYDAEYLSANGSDYYKDAYRGQKAADLLYWEGSGVYDEKSQDWGPSTSGIYWQAYEAWSTDAIYTDFLVGLSAMNEELTFSRIEENRNPDKIELGTGTVTFSFDWNHQRYTLEAIYSNNWFDTSMICQIGKIVDSDTHQLYVCHNQNDGMLLYYGSEEQCRKLNRITELNFHSAANGIL